MRPDISQPSQIAESSLLLSTLSIPSEQAHESEVPILGEQPGLDLAKVRIGQASLFSDIPHENSAIISRRERLMAETPDSSEDPARRQIVRSLLADSSAAGLAPDRMLRRLLRPVAEAALTNPTLQDSYSDLIATAISDPRTDRAVSAHSQVVARTDGRRADYAKIEGSQVVEALGRLAQAVTYNSGVGLQEVYNIRERLAANSNYDPRAHSRDVEGSVSINLNWSEAESVRIGCAKARESADVRVWLPCHAEPGAAHLNLEYAASHVGADRVICVNTNRYEDPRVMQTQRDLGKQAGHSAGVTLGLQDRLLKCVDWNQVEEQFSLQLMHDSAGQALPPAGSKGMTLLAIALIAEARSQVKESYILLHDTDIINPWQYNAIDYMSLPLMLNNGSGNLLDHDRGWAGIYLARTGPGRNNQPIHSALNGIISARGDLQGDAELAKELAVNCVIAPWLLTGERMIRGDLLRRMPWVNDMTIESQLNVLLAGEASENGRLTTAHVLDPMPKLENADVAPSREWRMINYCAQHHRDLIGACAMSGKVPAAWGIDEIRSWNAEYGRFNSIGAITNDGGHTTNIAYASSRPHMLPSIEMLREMGLVDWGRVLELAESDTSALKRGINPIS